MLDTQKSFRENIFISYLSGNQTNGWVYQLSLPILEPRGKDGSWELFFLCGTGLSFAFHVWLVGYPSKPLKNRPYQGKTGLISMIKFVCQWVSWVSIREEKSIHSFYYLWKVLLQESEQTTLSENNNQIQKRPICHSNISDPQAWSGRKIIHRKEGHEAWDLKKLYLI